MNKKVALCIVLYNPDGNDYLNVLQRLAPFEGAIFVYDNSLPDRAKIVKSTVFSLGLLNLTYFGGNGNIGLSAAYNQVSHAAKHSGMQSILLFDQDSDVTLEQVNGLIANYEQFRMEAKVGVYAAFAVRKNGVPYRLLPEHEINMNDRKLLGVKFAPSSFSLIPIQALETVGWFYDDFFIDHIDVDLCHRLKNKGYQIIIDTSVPFVHKIGNGDLVLFGKYISPISSPFRHYYQIRNSIISTKRSGIALAGCFFEITKRFAVVMLSGLKAGSLTERLKYCLMGLYDGLRNRAGQMKL